MKDIPENIDEMLFKEIAKTKSFKKINCESLLNATKKDFKKYEELVNYVFSRKGVSDYLNNKKSVFIKEHELDEKYENAYFIDDLI